MRVDRLLDQAFALVVGDEIGKRRRLAHRAIDVEQRDVGARTPMANDLAQQSGCEFDEGPLGTAIRVGAWRQTSAAGVFAVDDAASLTRNATFASASGVAAGVGVHRSPICRLYT